MKQVFVGNLEWETTEDELRRLFEDAAFEVTRARVMKDVDTGKGRGFGFIDLDDAVDLAVVVDRMHGMPLRGRKIGVEVAKRANQRT